MAAVTCVDVDYIVVSRLGLRLGYLVLDLTRVYISSSCSAQTSFGRLGLGPDKNLLIISCE